MKGFRATKQVLFAQAVKKGKRDYTLDIDATAILAEKKEAEMTYKGFRGYMPMVGHLAENGLVIYAEFRQGNVSPSAKNLEFIKHCERQMPRGKRIGYLRADAASYQAEIFNYCEQKGIKFAIGAHIDRAVKEAILSIKEDEWRP
ncbi:MAG: transposase [Candidatus Desulfofervidus auxilii]|nr:transposase [Candidatus Desulfofervidus auxilii]